MPHKGKEFVQVRNENSQRITTETKSHRQRPIRDQMIEMELHSLGY